jgi:hypothetical protein
MKRIIAVAVFLLTLVMAPSGFAQAHALPPITWIVVGNDTPGARGGALIDRIDDGDDMPVLLAQQFSLSSPSYINRIDLAFESLAEVTCTFSVAITQSLGPGYGYGSPLLQRSESAPATPPQATFLVSDTFPAILLPAGTYFLVLDGTTGGNPCSTAAPDDFAIFWFGGSSPEAGTVGPIFYADAPFLPWAQGSGPPFAFDLAGPPLVPPTGGGLGQIARLVVEGPVTPAPGGPVEAQIGFLDPVTGTPVAPLSIVTLNAGQAQSVDVPLSPLVTRIGQHVDLLPVIAQPPGAVQANPIQLSATVQILDAVTGFGTVLSHALQPGASVPTLGPQILAGGQTLRVTVVAGTDPCIGNVGFNDLNGNPLVQSTPLNLMPGTGTSVDLDADTLSLKLGQRIEAQPALTVTQPAAAVALNSVCQASAEVFDHVTGRTWSYQSTMAALPAVQSAAAAPQ